MLPGQQHTAVMEHLCAPFDEGQHGLVAEPSESPGLRVSSWVPVIDPVHVREDLAHIRLQKGRALSINLTLNNVTNNTDMKTGGYEQNRDDNYDDGRDRPYQFSRHSKYYYAQGLNGFLNVGFRF